MTTLRVPVVPIVPINCHANHVFDNNRLEIKNLFFPITHSGMVSQEDCRDSTDDEVADLVTDPERKLLICHRIYCDHYSKESE